MNGDSNQPKINPWVIAFAVILPTFIEVLDTTVVSVALENIAGNLAATVSQATWVQTGYLISNAIVLPASAWFSAKFGREFPARWGRTSAADNPGAADRRGSG